MFRIRFSIVRIVVYMWVGGGVGFDGFFFRVLERMEDYFLVICYEVEFVD